MSASTPEAQDALFTSSRPQGRTHHSNPSSMPTHLQRATLRMEFPPSYVLVGVYRLVSDPGLYKPIWDKCRHGVRRGVVVGLVWAVLTFGIQQRFIKVFLRNSPKITGLSNETVFGVPVPFNMHTYAAILYMAEQVTFIIRFFLSKNMGIARDRAWEHTVASRGKGPSFFQPYVEEWDNPPVVDSRDGWLEKLVGGWVGMMIVKRVILTPVVVLYPFVGTLVSAWFRALGMSRALHRRYFEAKKMSKQQIAVYMEERKWSYRVFGFTAALLESLPLVGLLFTVSNRIGAAMWAFDLEKRQHFVAEERRLKLEKSS